MYWSNYLGADGGAVGSIMSAPIGAYPTPPPTVIASSAGIAPWDLAVSPTYVYWTNYGGTIVMRAAIGGGGPVETIVPGPPPNGNTTYGGYIAVSTTAVYWTAGGATATSGAVMSVPLDGGAPTQFVGGQNGIADIAVDDDTVFWSNSGGTIMAARFDGGAPVTLAEGQEGPQNIALDSTSVYWANYAGGQVMKVAKP